MNVNEMNSLQIRDNDVSTQRTILSEISVIKNSQEEMSIAVASNLSKNNNKKNYGITYSDILKRVETPNDVRDITLLLNARDMINKYSNIISNSSSDYSKKSNIIYRLKEEGVEPALIYISIITAGMKENRRMDHLYRNLAEDFSSDKDCLNSIHTSFNIGSIFSKKMNSPLLESSLRKLYFFQNNSISSPSKIVNDLLEYVDDDESYIEFLNVYREALLKDISSLKPSSNENYLFLIQKKLSNIISSVSLMKLVNDEIFRFEKLIPKNKPNIVSLSKDICLIIGSLNEDNSEILLERVAYENIKNLNVFKQKSFIYVLYNIIKKLSESFWETSNDKILTIDTLESFCMDKNYIY